MQFSPGNTILATWEPYMGMFPTRFNRGFVNNHICVFNYFFCSNPFNSFIISTVTKDQAAGTPNLNLWNVRTGELIKGFVQKKQQGWYAKKK